MTKPDPQLDFFRNTFREVSALLMRGQRWAGMISGDSLDAQQIASAQHSGLRVLLVGSADPISGVLAAEFVDTVYQQATYIPIGFLPQGDSLLDEDLRLTTTDGLSLYGVSAVLAELDRHEGYEELRAALLDLPADVLVGF